MSFRFEKLDVWHKAIELADFVYSFTKAFPSDERFGLVSQLRRAAVSISSNVAEGSGRGTDKEFARFLEIAYGSLMETISQSNVALRQSYLRKTDFDKLNSAANELARMLSGLRNSLKN